MTTVTITVEYEGKTPKEDLGVQERLTLEQITQSKFDLVCATIHKLVGMINKALKEKRNEGKQ
jgi:hypothetical protein